MVDAFGNKFKNRKVSLRVTSSEIEEVGLGKFLDRAESQGVQQIMFTDLSRFELVEFRSITPTIFLEANKVSTSIEIVPGGRNS